MRIILDYGHGGFHPNPQNGKLQYVTAGKRMVKDGIEFYEGVNNRIVGRMVKDALEELGHEIIETAPSWIDIPLWQRAEHANQTDADFLISIHSDAHGNGSEWSTANGMGCFIYNHASSNSKKLADSLNNALICNFDGWVKNRGIKKANFSILRKPNMPCVLIEMGFHTNRIEVMKLQEPLFREMIVKSIVEAIEEYKLKLK